MIGVRGDLTIPEDLRGEPSDEWHSRALRMAQMLIPDTARSRWVWWNLPLPQKRTATFSDIIEEIPQRTVWNTRQATDYLVSLMGPLHRKKLDSAIELTKRCRTRVVGGVYRRTRGGQQRAEIRFDEIAGCLRTPVGGSSRQTILLVERGQVRSRLLSPREAARLMGLPDSYILPEKYNQAYYLCGDGVVVPVVRHVAAHILEPIWIANLSKSLHFPRAA